MRRLPQFHDPYLGVLLDARKGLAAAETAILREARDLSQDGVLHLDGLVERPVKGEHAADRAGQYDDCGQPDEETSAQRPYHDGRSTIHPTPRTLRIAVAPSFCGWCGSETRSRCFRPPHSTHKSAVRARCATGWC